MVMEITPVGPPPEAATVEETHQRFENVRRFITLARLAWAEETLEKREAHDHVIRRAPGRKDDQMGQLKFDSDGNEVKTTDDGYIIRTDEEGNEIVVYEKAVTDPHGARLVRGFKTPSQKREDVPLSFSERHNASRREKQVRKIRGNDIKISGISQYYGDAEEVKEGDDWAPDLRFVVPARASRAQRRQIQKDRRRAMRAENQTRRINASLDKSGEGRTIPARIRQRKINSSRNRVNKLRAKLED
jgi:hypothetical protein